ncbi:MAG: GNAT family N-acetyltransferase [Methanoregulaceae archaeon]
MDSAGTRRTGPGFDLPGSTPGEPGIHLMKREETGGVTRLMYEAYGNTYPKKYVYDSEQLREKQEKGEIVSVVATNPANQVIGYGLLNAYNGYPSVGLLGSLVVSPSCRGQGLAGKIARYLVICGESRGFACLTAGAFTVHPYSQQVFQKLGYHPSALLLGSQPQEISFRGIYEKLDQPESVVFLTKVTSPHEYGPQYLPDRHAEMIREIGCMLGIRILPGTRGKPGREPSRIEHAINTDTGAGLIWIRNIGPDYRDALGAAVGQILVQDSKVMRLHVNLSDPGSPALVSAAEENGFIFSGILPGETGIILLLQHLQGIPISYNRIRMGNSSGKCLLAYIRSCNPVEAPLRETND